MEAGEAMAHWRDRDTGGMGLTIAHWHESSRRLPLPKTWPHPTACRLQCWDSSGQTTNRVGTQPHPSADSLLKVVLNKQLPDNKHTRRYGPSHQRDKPQLHPPVGGYQPPN